MKKLYYSLIVLLVVFVGLVMPKVNAAGDFDDDAHCIGYIDYYERNDIGQITGAWVYIVDSSVLLDTRYFWFNSSYFQPDILVLQEELIGKTLIWNPFDESGAGDYNGRWWLLTGYVGDDIADAYQNGYNDGIGHGYGIGYEDGYGAGQAYGFDQGYAVGGQIGYQSGYEDGYIDGYDIGHDDGREQVLNSIENMEILYQNITLLNGVRDEIVDNAILIDRVGVAVFDGSENWSFAYHSSIGYLRFNLNGIPTNSSINPNNTNDWISNLFESKASETSECLWINNNTTSIVIHRDTLIGYGGFVYGSISTYVPALKEWLAEQKNAGEPLTVWYKYAEPVEYDLVSLLTNADGSFNEGYNVGYNEGRVHVQKENRSLLSVIPTTIGSIWLMISDFLSYEVFGLNLWSIIMMFAGFSLLILIIKMVI